MRIIPAIDIIEGKCVRLTKGDYTQLKTYNENPLEVAKAFEDVGIRYLHLVDLDGAKSSGIVNYRILEDIASKTNLLIDFGGGIKTDKDIEIAFNSGANQITGGSIAVNDENTFMRWLAKYGPGKIILGADSNNRKIATNGWIEESNIDIIDFLKYYQNNGVSSVIATDISKDGMLEGPSFELYNEILDNTSIKLIASGGVSSINDLEKLAEQGCDGAIIGKAIYEGFISLDQLSRLC